MNFLSCVCVDIMGSKFKLIFVWPNLAVQAKGYCTNTRVGIRSLLFLSENIFFLVSSHLRHFSGVCEGPIHYLPVFLRGAIAHMVVCVVCVFTCLSVLVLRQLSWTLRLLAYIQHVLMHLCMCEQRVDGCVHACICLLPFIACSIFCIT